MTLKLNRFVKSSQIPLKFVISQFSPSSPDCVVSIPISWVIIGVMGLGPPREKLDRGGSKKIDGERRKKTKKVKDEELFFDISHPLIAVTFISINWPRAVLLPRQMPRRLGGLASSRGGH